MAYIDKSYEDEEKKVKKRTAPATSGSSGVISAPTSTTGATPPNSSKRSGSGFVNPNVYTKANKEQSGQMGETIQQNLSGKLGETEDKVTAYKQGFTPQEDKTDYHNKVIGDINSGNIDSNLDAITAGYNSVYEGPANTSEIGGYEDVQSSFNKLDPTFNNLKTGEGVQQTIKEVYSPENYSHGESILDSAVVRGGQGAENLKASSDAYIEDKTAWKNILSDFDTQIDQNKQNVDDTRDMYQTAVQDKVSDYSGIFDTALSDLQTQNSGKLAEIEALESGLASSSIQDRQSVYNKLGIEKDVGESLRESGFDFSSLYDTVGNQGLGDVLSDQDIANYDILNSISNSGIDYNFDKTGNEEAAYKLNQDKQAEIKQYAELNKAIQDNLLAEQAERDKLYNDFVNKSSSPIFSPTTRAESMAAADILGLTHDQYLKAVDYGIDFTDYIDKGINLNKGDIIKQDEADVYKGLKESLGILDDSYKDTQNEGSAYNINTQDLVNLISSISDNPFGDIGGIAGINDTGTALGYNPFYDNTTVAQGDATGIAGEWMGSKGNPVAQYKQMLREEERLKKQGVK